MLNPKPIWMMEVTALQQLDGGRSFNPNFRRTFEFFWGHGYTAFCADSSGSKVTREIVEALACAQEGVVGGSHNFVFVPPDLGVHPHFGSAEA